LRNVKCMSPGLLHWYSYNILFQNKLSYRKQVALSNT